MIIICSCLFHSLNSFLICACFYFHFILLSFCLDIFLYSTYLFHIYIHIMYCCHCHINSFRIQITEWYHTGTRSLNILHWFDGTRSKEMRALHCWLLAWNFLTSLMASVHAINSVCAYYAYSAEEENELNILHKFVPDMMTSSNGNIFRVTGHLCGEFTGPRWIPHTMASDAELWCLLWSAPG